MSVMMDNEGQQEKVMDEVTQLEVTSEGVILSTFFDEPKLVPGVQVKKIDFMSSTVTLTAINSTEG
jgi:predicted RNA-binding protein